MGDIRPDSDNEGIRLIAVKEPGQNFLISTRFSYA